MVAHREKEGERERERERKNKVRDRERQRRGNTRLRLLRLTPSEGGRGHGECEDGGGMGTAGDGRRDGRQTRGNLVETPHLYPTLLIAHCVRRHRMNLLRLLGHAGLER